MGTTRSLKFWKPLLIGLPYMVHFLWIVWLKQWHLYAQTVSIDRQYSYQWSLWHDFWGKEYNQYYLLAYGIYPEWSCFVQTIHQPNDKKHKHFVWRQKRTTRIWNGTSRCSELSSYNFQLVLTMEDECICRYTITSCIFYNMLVDDKLDVSRLDNILGGLSNGNMSWHRGLLLEELVIHIIEIENEETHYGLRGDFIEHL